MAYPTEYLTEIYQLLDQHFNQEELRTLCFTLEVDYDSLGGSGKSAKARELVLYLNRRNQIGKLEPAVQGMRPDIVWPQLPAGTAGSESGTAVPGQAAAAPAAGIGLNKSDFDRLVLILQELPEFATEGRRLDFLTEVFFDSPRKRDILGRFNVSGMPRSVAIRLVNWLIQFGQDKPGRETLGVLVYKLKDSSIGGGANAEFLHGLLVRYPTGIEIGNEMVGSEAPAPYPEDGEQPSGTGSGMPGIETPAAQEGEQEQGAASGAEPSIIKLEDPMITLPSQGERFLPRTDRSWLANAVGRLARFQNQTGRRNLLIASEIPDRWIGEMNLDGGAVEVASTIINDLEIRGRLPDRRKTHALGSLMETVAVESFGYESAVKAVALIFRYQLDADRETLNQLSEQFGVPLQTFVDDSYELPWQPPRGSLPAGLRRAALQENLEALHYNGRKNWLDVEFLEAGARAARSVCRLEWGMKGEGSGFLVAPDLILTNYHVIEIPPGVVQAGGLPGRLKNCTVRFGAAKTESAGKRVVKLHQDALVKSSEPGQLDYALLRLKEPVEDDERIVSATLSGEEISEEQYANIIQHPLGDTMKVALRYNQVVKLAPGRVYYLSDTLKGSSGSPVFDDAWRVIALHRAGGLKDDEGQVILEANEGVPMLDILEEIQPYLTGGV
ncbi:MAG: trypsin-like peptidase domain-containing protein [Candidatus Promineifilaceae bacterium]